MKKETRRKRRVRVDRVLLLVMGCVLTVALVVGGVMTVRNLFHHPIIAEEYANANTNKLENDKIKNEVYSYKDEESQEEKVVALHTPELSAEVNEQIKQFVDSVIQEKAKVTHVDYESSSAFDQYKSYVITAVTYQDMDGLNPIQPGSQKKLYLNFDQDQVVDIEDCIRGKAISLLAFQNSCDQDQIKLAKISEKGITVDANGKNIEYTYQDNNTSFVMSNTNIPSILKYPRIDVQKRELDPNKPMVAFTFDDGPCPGHTERLLAAFESVGGRGTFFELGSLMEAYPDTVRAVVESGSEVANHSYNHDWLTQLSIPDAQADIQKVNDIFFSLTGNEITLLRPPYGDMNQELASQISENIVYWDVDTRDWESRNTDKIIETTKNYMYDGAVVLFHDIHATTIPAVEQLIQYYHALGYQFVTVSELYEARGM